MVKSLKTTIPENVSKKMLETLNGFSIHVEENLFKAELTHPHVNYHRRGRQKNATV